MSYTVVQKDELLKILVSKDFDIKNSTIEFNKKYNTTLQRSTIYDWLKDDTVFKEKYDSFQEELLDEAERMHRLLRRGIPIKDESGEIIAWQEKPDGQRIEFFLKTKGKDRGYVEQSKVDITTQGEKINNNFFTAKDFEE